MLIPILVVGFLAGATPQVGETAPDFTVQDTTGTFHSLSEMVKKGPVILAFFPKAFTSGCTRELTTYRDRAAEVEKYGVQLLAVSTDDAPTLVKFKDSLKAPFAFIPDPEAKLTSLYDVKAPVFKLANRFTFVIGEDRKVLRVDSGGDAVDPSGALASFAMTRSRPVSAPAPQEVPKEAPKAQDSGSTPKPAPGKGG